MCGRFSEAYNSTERPVIPIAVPLFESIVIILILFFALVANGLLIFLFLRDHRMQTTTNFFVISHIVSEFFMSCQGLGISFYVLAESGEMNVSHDSCVLVSFANLFFFYASFLSLTAIAVNRYLAVVKKVHHKITTNKAKAIISLIWMLALVASLPWGSILGERPKKEHRFLAWLVYCKNTPGIFDDISEAGSILSMFWAVLCIGVPIIILLVCFYFIMRSALQNRRQVSVSYNIHHVAADSYARSAFTTLLIIAVYLVCNAFIVPLIICPSSAKNELTAFVYRSIIWLRSATYPVVYTLRNPIYFRLLQRKLLQISTYCCQSCQSACPCCLKSERTSYKSPQSPTTAPNTIVAVEMQRKMRAHTSSQDSSSPVPANKQLRAWYLYRPKMAFTDLASVEGTSNPQTCGTKPQSILKTPKQSKPNRCQVVPFEP